MELVVLMLAAAVSGSTIQVEAAPPSSTVCEKVPGHVAGPFAPDVETARSIFLAVEKARAPRADIEQFPVVEVVDQGDHWSVFRTRDYSNQKPVVLPDGMISLGVRSFGGGQLEMDIDKCTASVSRVHFSK